MITSTAKKIKQILADIYTQWHIYERKMNQTWAETNV